MREKKKIDGAVLKLPKKLEKNPQSRASRVGKKKTT